MLINVQIDYNVAAQRMGSTPSSMQTMTNGLIRKLKSMDGTTGNVNSNEKAGKKSTPKSTPAKKRSKRKDSADTEDATPSKKSKVATEEEPKMEAADTSIFEDLDFDSADFPAGFD